MGAIQLPPFVDETGILPVANPAFGEVHASGWIFGDHAEVVRVFDRFPEPGQIESVLANTKVRYAESSGSCEGISTRTVPTGAVILPGCRLF